MDQQKVIKADHLVNLVDGEDQHKPCKKLPKTETAPEVVPNCDYQYAHGHSVKPMILAP